MSTRGHGDNATYQKIRFASGTAANTPINGEKPSLRQIVAAGQMTTNAITAMNVDDDQFGHSDLLEHETSCYDRSWRGASIPS